MNQKFDIIYMSAVHPVIRGFDATWRALSKISTEFSMRLINGSFNRRNIFAYASWRHVDINEIINQVWVLHSIRQSADQLVTMALIQGPAT